MKCCPFCLQVPSVRQIQMGCVELWQIGCEAHLAGAARQPELVMAMDQWNYVVDQIMPVARAA